MITISPMSQNDNGPLEYDSTPLTWKDCSSHRVSSSWWMAQTRVIQKAKAGLTKPVPSKTEVGNLKAGRGGKQWAKSTRSNIT